MSTTPNRPITARQGALLRRLAGLDPATAFEVALRTAWGLESLHGLDARGFVDRARGRPDVVTERGRDWLAANPVEEEEAR